MSVGQRNCWKITRKREKPSGGREKPSGGRKPLHAGSHGIFDLVALNRKHIRLIQVKKDRITKQEIENLIKLSNLPENCVKEVWFRNERGWEVKTVKSNNSLSILENEA